MELASEGPKPYRTATPITAVRKTRSTFSIPASGLSTSARPKAATTVIRAAA
jgi:hypothetical protein